MMKFIKKSTKVSNSNYCKSIRESKYFTKKSLTPSNSRKFGVTVFFL